LFLTKQSSQKNKRIWEKRKRHEKAEVTYLPVWFCLLVVRKAHSKRKTPGRLQRSFRAAKIEEEEEEE
jgi:hypothetical protein